MVLELLAIGGGAFVVYALAAIVAKKLLNRGALGNFLLQMVTLAGLGVALFFTGHVAIAGAIGVALYPLYARILHYLFLYALTAYAQHGGFGKETKWAAELFEENDDEFIEATKALDTRRLREIGIVAESKEGLRDLTIEQYEEADE